MAFHESKGSGTEDQTILYLSNHLNQFLSSTKEFSKITTKLATKRFVTSSHHRTLWGWIQEERSVKLLHHTSPVNQPGIGYFIPFSLALMLEQLLSYYMAIGERISKGDEAMILWWHEVWHTNNTSQPSWTHDGMQTHKYSMQHTIKPTQFPLKVFSAYGEVSTYLLFFTSIR